MNIYEDEEYEIKMNRITDRMGYLILDLIAMAIEKLEQENQIYDDLLQLRLETKNDHRSDNGDF
jgi:ATP-dependent RNA circularization protein (DNA/RNA ligase family)